jgi:hypothetical protein
VTKKILIMKDFMLKTDENKLVLITLAVGAAVETH